MCGIAGLLTRNGTAVTPEVLAAQCNAIEHRGPDDSGMYYNGNFGFCMRRLAIMDIAGGHQPIFSADQSHAIIFNGEIVNHKVLREQLVTLGAHFTSDSDTETLLAAYLQWGDDCWTMLEGMYAVAIWDVEARVLTLARDPLGIKPLYIAQENGILAFASELKALYPVPGLEFDVNPDAVHDYFAYTQVRTPRSIYRNIETLPPGHIMRVGQDGVAQARRFWQPRFEEGPARSEQEWIDEFRTIWLETVERHMLADVPLGAFLSGGVDSSAVVAAMRQISDAPVTAFTIGFPDKRFNELPYAQQVAQHLGCEHHHEIIDLERARDILPRLQQCYDEPFADSSAVATWYLSRLAVEKVKVVLSGDGGDEVFAGYTRHYNEALMARLQKLPAIVRNAGHLTGMIPRLPSRRWNYARNRARRVWAAAQLPDAISRFSEKTQATRTDIRQGLYTDAFAAEIGHRDEVSAQAAETRALIGELSGGPVEQFMLADTIINLPCDMLTKMDRTSMAHSLEVRVPFLSHKLVDWAATMPLDMKLRGRTGKYVVRKAVEDWLPPGIFDRPKQGFSLPLADWFAGDFSKFARDIWYDSGAARAGYLAIEPVERAFDEHRRNERDHSMLLYALAMFGLWWGNRPSASAATARRTLAA